MKISMSGQIIQDDEWIQTPKAKGMKNTQQVSQTGSNLKDAQRSLPLEDEWQW